MLNDGDRYICVSRVQHSFSIMTKKEIIKYLRKNKDILSIRAISQRSGFHNLHKVLNGQEDSNGFPFTFPEKHVPKVLKQIKRLQAKISE